MFSLFNRHNKGAVLNAESKTKKIVIPGGSGQIGMVLTRWFQDQGHEVVVLTRGTKAPGRSVKWDGKSEGDWFTEIDGADVVINLAGRTVNCRYTEENLKQMMDSRVDSTRIVGQAIDRAENPPAVWLQMSTATIYAHTFDEPNDEFNGEIGGGEPDAPAYWKRSIDIALAWEKALDDAPTQHTRKVAMRTAMLMSPDKDGILDVIKGLTRLGLGGTIGSGKQWVSWIHADDFCRAVEHVLTHQELSGAINFCAPNPLPQRQQMQELREVMGISVGLPATAWMARLGAVFMRTDAELVLKSRRVVPGRLLASGFEFDHANWKPAIQNLLA